MRGSEERSHEARDARDGQHVGLDAALQRLPLDERAVRRAVPVRFISFHTGSSGLSSSAVLLGSAGERLYQMTGMPLTEEPQVL